jgi:hypothetical protein
MTQYSALRRRLILLATILSACSSVVTTVRAQSVLAQPGATASPRNPLSIAAANVGVHQCLATLSALAGIGVRDASNSDVLLDWDRRRPDKAPVFSLLGLEHANGTAAMSVTATPEADGSCSVAAERIAFDPRMCKQVAQKDLQGYQMTQLLPHMAVYARAQEPGSSVSLIDSPPGCLTIRRFVKFSAKTTGSVLGGAAQ